MAKRKSGCAKANSRSTISANDGQTRKLGPLNKIMSLLPGMGSMHR